MKGKSSIRKPNGLLYFLVWLLIFPALKIIFRLKVDCSGFRPFKGPVIVVCNHQSYMDFLLAMLTLYPRRLNAVAAQKFFFYRPLDKLLPLMGCIPKNLFDPDPRSIRAIMNVIKRKGSVLLFPEGRCSVDGMYMGMHRSTGKLIKKLGVPVVGCRIEGAYNCMPFWRGGMRAGPVCVIHKNLFTAEETRSVTLDEINAGIDDFLSGSAERKTQGKPYRLFRGTRLAEGLENILYRCPSCGREFTLETKGDVIRCRVCGNAAAMDKSAKLTPLSGSVAPCSVHDWYKEQAIFESRFLRENEEPTTAFRVAVRMPRGGGGGLAIFGRGELRLDRSGWHYNGVLCGKHSDLFFPVETVPAIPFDPNNNFQIYAKGNFYVFTPEENSCACAKYATLGECAYWLFSADVQMTKGADGGFCEEGII